MKRIHFILSGLSLVIILLSLNRLTTFTSSYLQPFDFLRLLDFNAMIPIPLLSVILYYLLKKEITYDHPFRKTLFYTLIGMLMISGIFLFGAGSGDHEVTNYLNTRFCGAGRVDSVPCNIIKFNDDEFSHYVYYFGFIFINVGLMLMEYHLPRKKRISKMDAALIIVNGLFIALGIFANLAFEDIGLDLFFFGSVMVLALYLLWKKSFTRIPVTFYFAVAYTAGVAGTFLYKFLKG